MVWRITPSNLLVDDPDAITYLAAVETADGQALESGVRLAVNAFIKGCKADGIWPAIKASCILAGARTLSGALVPLVGTAPTNNNFVSGDYNRKTGLVGDGSSKYLNTNRNNNADPQNNQHLSAFLSTFGSGALIGSRNSSTPFGASQVNYASNTLFLASRLTATQGQVTDTVLTNKLYGVSRSQSGNFALRYNGASATVSDVSASPNADSINIFSRGGVLDNYGSHRLAFYSIGESLDLALLDSRVTTLINALAAAIP